MAFSRPVSSQQIGLFLVLDQAGLRVDVKDFDQRLVLQKAVYLLQSANVHFGYHYRWYLRGPYCSALADDLFYLASFPEEEKTRFRTYSVDATSQKSIMRIKGLFDAGDRKAQATQLELLASVLFLFRTGQARHEDVAGTTRVLKNAHKPYELDAVRGAVEKLKAHGLIG